MKIRLAQIHSSSGKINENIEKHLQFIKCAAAHNVDFIVFPELSVTGYEPTLGKKLAFTVNDSRLARFQKCVQSYKIIASIGAPIVRANGISISNCLFTPHGQPNQYSFYSKQFLHPDEEPFFIPRGETQLGFPSLDRFIFAICYEISIPEHVNRAMSNTKSIYLANVAKHAQGIEKAYHDILSINRTFNIMTMIVNGVGECDDFIQAGQSAAWDDQGNMIGNLDETQEAILVIDTGKNNSSILTA